MLQYFQCWKLLISVHLPLATVFFLEAGSSQENFVEKLRDLNMFVFTCENSSLVWLAF